MPKFNPKTWEHRKLGALWLRFLKEIDIDSTTIPEEFLDNPDVMKAVELTKESAYTKAELAAYDEYLDAVRVDAYAEGRKERDYAIAHNLLKEEVSPDLIQKVTNLTLEEIKNLT